MPERRQQLRRPLFIECSWTRDARVIDLSPQGCYVDAVRVPRLGEVVEFELDLDSPVTLRGTVVHRKEGVGFAVSFDGLSEEAAVHLHAFLMQRRSA